MLSGMKNVRSLDSLSHTHLNPALNVVPVLYKCVPLLKSPLTFKGDILWKI